ncbi:MAG: hypothetical protein C4335_10630 [Armatimonadota bacterium]
MINNDWTDGDLNNETRYPASGTADAGVGLQWNIGDLSASNSVDQIVSYEWDLDNDGQFDDATGAQVPYRWDTLGQFLISVRVRDNRGREDIDSAVITVVPDRDLQVAQVSLNPPENLKDGQVVTANVRIRNDGIDAASQSFRVVLLASAGGANERWGQLSRYAQPGRGRCHRDRSARAPARQRLAPPGGGGLR